jgi:hypothetical protein
MFVSLSSVLCACCPLSLHMPVEQTDVFLGGAALLNTIGSSFGHACYFQMETVNGSYMSLFFPQISHGPYFSDYQVFPHLK